MPFKNLLLIFLCLAASIVYSQNKDRIYFDEDWVELKNDEYAAYYRIVTKTKAGYNASDYYLNGTKQMDGWFADKKCNTYNGKFTWYDSLGKVSKTASYKNNISENEYLEYYRNGQIKVSEFYTEGERNGNYKEFYEDGSLRAEATYVKGRLTGPAYRYFEDGSPALIMELDEKGSGDVEAYYENGKLRTKGELEDGYCTGYWTNYHSSGKGSYITELDDKELYKQMLLDLNIIYPGDPMDSSFNSLDDVFFEGYDFNEPKIYDCIANPDVVAEFIGGFPEMTKFIQDNLYYPDIAVKRNKQGKVYVRFVVETDGSVSNVRVVSGPICLREEAIRVISSMPDWNPAEFEGNYVKSEFQIPINYSFD